MQTIEIPRIPSLDSLASPDVIVRELETGGVRASIGNVNWPEKFPYAPLATLTAAHNGTHLYIDFFVRGLGLRAENSADQSPVSSDSCVEVFLSPEHSGEYWNFEFNCIGAINASHRRVRPEPVRLDAHQLASVRRYPSCGTSPFSEKAGVHAWNLLVVIPLDLMGIESCAPGTRLAGNFYKCASASAWPHYLSWAPIHTEKPDFHRPEFFGTLILK